MGRPQWRRRDDAAKLQTLRAAIEAGFDDLERGECVEREDADLSEYLDGLTGVRVTVHC